jgi:hypothetical protein
MLPSTSELLTKQQIGLQIWALRPSFHFWHMLFRRPYEFWLELDNQFLSCCAAVLRLPGASKGADEEVRLAQRPGTPVFYGLHKLADFFGKKRIQERT